MTTTIESVRDYLEFEVKFLKSKSIRNRTKYFSISDFVVQNGARMEYAPLPNEITRGPMKECYRNATAQCTHRERWIYCEGYACGIIPVMHAWCYDTQTGKVVDTTWRDNCHEYFGIVFKRTYVWRMMRLTGTYGVIDQWQHKWPVLSDPPEQWRHPIMDKLSSST